MPLYQAEPWHDLFAMTGGAAAALAGLIFVAVSLNQKEILENKGLPGLAAQTLAILVGLVLMCAVCLTPGQSAELLGIELIVLGLALIILMLGSTLRSFTDDILLRWRASRVALGIVGTVPMLAVGVSLTAGAGGGLIWTLGEITTGLLVAVYYAWILLVEIRR